MNRFRVGIGLVTWCAVIGVLGWYINVYLVRPTTTGHRVAADLWEFASAERRVVSVRLDPSWPIAVGDPIYRVDGPDRIDRVGEIRRVVPSAERARRGGDVAPTAEALLYPHAPPVCSMSYLTYYETPTSLAWVMETMLPPAKRARIAEEVMASYQDYHAEILEAIEPLVVSGFRDAFQIVDEDFAAAIARRRSALEQLGSRYQSQVVQQELVPLIQQEIWPIVRRHAEPLANEIGGELFQRASLWRFGWRLAYDRLPLPEKNLTRAEWTRFVQEEAIPVLQRHATDFIHVQQQILEEIGDNPRVRTAVRRNLVQVVDDPEFREIVWDIFREVILDNPRLHQRLEMHWSGAEAQRAKQLAASYAEPSVRRIGDILLGTREDGISPEFAQVLRNQILDKDCRWLVLHSPPSATPITNPSTETVLPVRWGGYPEVNPFAVQLHRGSR
jgi:hypothetical protein